jgi:hypothetical protein
MVVKLIAQALGGEFKPAAPAISSPASSTEMTPEGLMAMGMGAFAPRPYERPRQGLPLAPEQES